MPLLVHAGVSLDMAAVSSFWALFFWMNKETPWDAFAEQVAARRKFSIAGVTRRGSTIHTSFTMRFTWGFSPHPYFQDPLSDSASEVAHGACEVAHSVHAG